MTTERESDLFEQARRDYTRGITLQEIQEIEIEYGIECSNKHCAGCVLKWLKRILPYYDLKIQNNQKKSKKTQKISDTSI